MEHYSGVRPARQGDEEALYNFLCLLHNENGLAPMNPDKVRFMISRATADNPSLFVGIIEGPDGIEASVGLGISEWWYSTDQHLEEVWTFVHPDHRKSTHAKHLYRFAKWSADRLSMPLLVGILTRKELEPKMHLVQREMAQVGALFIHGPVPGDVFNQRHIGG